MNIEYIGHSAFFIETAKAGILIDPFISGNPQANFNWQQKSITDIFLTHGHNDHFGDAIEIAKAKNAKITGMIELTSYCQDKGVNNVNGINLGGAIECGWGKAYFTKADHSSILPNGQYGGVASGVIIKADGKIIYHAGDTAVFLDMSLIGELYAPDIVMLPIGAHFTMGIKEALKAAELLNAPKVIPMHYNTFPAINADVLEFKKRLEQSGKECIYLKPGESYSI